MSTENPTTNPEEPKGTLQGSRTERKSGAPKPTQKHRQTLGGDPAQASATSQASSTAPETKRASSGKELREWLAVFIALIGLVVAVASLLYTSAHDRADREDEIIQRTTSQAVSTVEQATRQAAATSDAALAQEVVGLRKTQTVLEADQSRLLRMQVFPFIHAVNQDSTELTLTDTKIITDSSGALMIHGTGQLTATLANDGGSKAGLIDVQWTQKSTGGRIQHLRIDSITVQGQGMVNLPSTIENQSATLLKLEMASEVTASHDLVRNTPYQLGRVLSDILQAEGTDVIFQFSNADPLTLTVQAVSLAIPVQVIRTDPPSPFPVTDADQTGVVCVRLSDSGAVTTQGAHVQIVAPDGVTSATISVDGVACLTLPVREGDYHVRSETGWTQAFRVVPSTEFYLTLPRPGAVALVMADYSRWLWIIAGLIAVLGPTLFLSKSRSRTISVEW